MPDTIFIRVNGVPVSVSAESTLAAALLAGNAPTIRPLCGMGICFGCRVRVDGIKHVKSCQTICRPDMQVEVDEF